MAKNMSRHKTTKKFKLPSIDEKLLEMKKTLPFNGSAVTEKSFSFSFACFDRSHHLFNLGGGKTEGGTVPGNWFIDLLDCFKGISNMKIAEMKSSMYDLHPIDWNKTNASAPKGSEQCDYWQFRINKSKGRVIGILIDGVFYVVWLDPYHNLTDSEGYGAANYYKPAMSLYEMKEKEVQTLEEEVEHLRSELQMAETLLNEK